MVVLGPDRCRLSRASARYSVAVVADTRLTERGSRYLSIDCKLLWIRAVEPVAAPRGLEQPPTAADGSGVGSQFSFLPLSSPLRRTNRNNNRRGYEDRADDDHIIIFLLPPPTPLGSTISTVVSIV